jgi:hypothetical protein
MLSWKLIACFPWSSTKLEFFLSVLQITIGKIKFPNGMKYWVSVLRWISVAAFFYYLLFP